MERVVADDTSMLESFYRDLAVVDLQPLWTQAKELMPAQPAPRAQPWLWQGSLLRSLATRARDLITIERGGERRVLSLSNPGLGGAPFATPTLWGAIQALGPHESAPAHRHTAAAIRFVLEGEGVWTTVDGDACHMSPGDLVLTPAWTFHDHTNAGDEPMLWFDGLDSPLALSLDAIFYENHPELSQPVRGHNLSARAFGANGRVPSGYRSTEPHSPVLRYGWGESDAMLGMLLADSGDAMASIDFVDPTSGRPALPTMTCSLHRVVPGGRSGARRKTGNSIFVVFRGEGRSVIGGQSFEWSRGDMFVVPSWHPVDHEAATGGDLFEVSDEAALRALALFREERLGPQLVTSEFEPRSLDTAAP